MLEKIKIIIIFLLAIVAAILIWGWLRSDSLEKKIKEYENQKEISEQLQIKLDQALKEKDEALVSKDIRIAEIRAKELKTVENLSKSSKELQETKEDLIILKTEYSTTDEIVTNLEAQISLYEERESLFEKRESKFKLQLTQKEEIIFTLGEELKIKDDVIEIWKKKYQNQVDLNKVAEDVFKKNELDVKFFKFQRNIGTAGGIIIGLVTGYLIAK